MTRDVEALRSQLGESQKAFGDRVEQLSAELQASEAALQAEQQRQHEGDGDSKDDPITAAEFEPQQCEQLAVMRRQAASRERELQLKTNELQLTSERYELAEQRCSILAAQLKAAELSLNSTQLCATNLDTTRQHSVGQATVSVKTAVT